MTMILDYAPGMSLTDPFALIMATKGNPSYRVTAAKGMALVGAAVLADNHYINGIRTTLFECATNNSALQSQALGTDGAGHPWTSTNVTATNNTGDVTAPDGTSTATKLVPTATSSGSHSVSQSIAITASENLAISCHFRAGLYSAATLRISGVSFTNQIMVAVDLVNGVISTATAGTGVVTGSALIPLSNGWYRVLLWGTLGTDATTTLEVFAEDTYVHAQNVNTAWAGNTTSGIYAWGVQLERWGTLVKGNPTSYIPTTSGILGRNANSLSINPWPWQTMPFWGYAKFFDLGWSQRANFEPLVEFTDGSTNPPRQALFTGSGTGGANPSHRMNYVNGIGALQSAAIVSPGANYGDSVELFFRILSDATCEIQRSINGGATSVVSNQGASPDFFDFAAGSAGGIVLYLNIAASVGLMRLKLGMNPTVVTTLAQGAAA